MSPLSASSAAAIARLRAYAAPTSIYSSMPLSRRAAVLLLLFADRHGNLRVLLTLRASNISYAGQVSLPGGKADTLNESPFETARREASEEIGLPEDYLPPPFRVEHLCELPAHLSATEQCVRPCVAFLHTDDATKSSESTSTTSASAADTKDDNPSDITGESLIPRLNATEVAAVFSAPFHRFLSGTTEHRSQPSAIKYRGSWNTWHGHKWRMHNFFIPKTQLGVATASVKNFTPQSPSPSPSSSPALQPSPTVAETDGDDVDEENSYKVWGLTARILIDCARIAYDEEPEFEHNSGIGEERMLRRLFERGRLKGERERKARIARGPVEKAKQRPGPDWVEGVGEGVKEDSSSGGEGTQERGRGKL